MKKLQLSILVFASLAVSAFGDTIQVQYFTFADAEGGLDEIGALIEAGTLKDPNSFTLQVDADGLFTYDGTKKFEYPAGYEDDGTPNHWETRNLGVHTSGAITKEGATLKVEINYSSTQKLSDKIFRTSKGSAVVMPVFIAARSTSTAEFEYGKWKLLSIAGTKEILAVKVSRDP
jgi:hypothetical protein